MIRLKLNSATQVTKQTLQSQIKTLGCVYQVSSDKKTVAFGYGTEIKSASIVLTYTFQTGTCTISYNSVPIPNINLNQLEATTKKQQEAFTKGFQSILKLSQWLTKTGGSEAALLLT